MQRNEKIIFVRDVSAAIIEALDGVMAVQGMLRIATREIAEDWTPLLTEFGGPTVFVLSQPKQDWTACFSSLQIDDEWQVAEAIATALEQPTIYAAWSDATGSYAYRYFDEGILREEYMPGEDQGVDSSALNERVIAHGIPTELIDDRELNFNEEHLLVGYGTERTLQEALNNNQHEGIDEDLMDDQLGGV
jgi:hypothetical protein